MLVMKKRFALVLVVALALAASVRSQDGGNPVPPAAPVATPRILGNIPDGTPPPPAPPKPAFVVPPADILATTTHEPGDRQSNRQQLNRHHHHRVCHKHPPRHLALIGLRGRDPAHDSSGREFLGNSLGI